MKLNFIFVLLALSLIPAGLARAAEAKNVLFVVVTSRVMAARYSSVIDAIDSQLKVPGREGLNAGLITVHGCGKDAAKYSVPLGPNNAKAINETLKGITLEGTHEDLVEAMNIAKAIVSKYVSDKNQAVEVILYAETHCACTATNKHLEILGEIKEICEKANVVFNLDIITTATDKELSAFFDTIAEITGGKAHAVDGIDEEKTVLKKVVDRVVGGSRTAAPLTSSTPAKKTTEKPKEAPAPAKKEQPQPAPQRTDQKEKEKKTGGH